MSKIDEVIAVIHKANQSMERLLKKLDNRKPIDVNIKGKLESCGDKLIAKIKEDKDGN